jgi:hypothetical protein
VTPLPDGAVDRILAAVREIIPVDLNRDQLLSDLEGIRSMHRTGDDLRDEPSERRKNAAKIIATAEKLKTLIARRDDRLLWTSHRAALDRLIADAKTEFPARFVAMFGVGKVSAFEDLVGLMLKTTFENHFGQRAKYVRDRISDEVTGEFIDFVQAALKELKITKLGRPYSRNSIAAALSRARKMEIGE